MAAPYPVLPVLSGGKKRTHEMARLLSERGFEVTLLAPYKPGQRAAYDANCGFGFKEVFYPFLLPLLLTDRPFPYGYLTSFHPGFGVMLRKLFSGFDVIQFEHSFWAGLLDALSPTQVVVYGSHNVEYDYLTSECENETVRRIVGKRAQELELRMCRRADLTLCCTAADAARMAELYGGFETPPLIAPNGIQPFYPPDAPARPLAQEFPGIERFSRQAVFSGSNVAHNRVVVQWIFDELAPRMAERWAFIIHGGVGDTFRDRETPPNVFFDDDWEGFGRYANTGAVGLNPITQGSGMNLKLINYLAHRLPTVTTPFGLRGCEDLAPLTTVRPMEEFAQGLDEATTPNEGLDALLPEYLWTTIMDRVADRLHQLVGAAQST